MDVFHIVAIGELKGEKISAAHKGQLEDYLSVLLSSQPFRNYCFGFITIRKFWWLRQTSVQKILLFNIQFQWFIYASLTSPIFTAGPRALSWLSNLS